MASGLVVCGRRRRAQLNKLGGGHPRAVITVTLPEHEFAAGDSPKDSGLALQVTSEEHIISAHIVPSAILQSEFCGMPSSRLRTRFRNRMRKVTRILSWRQ